MIRRPLVSTLALLALVFSLAACGDDGDGNNGGGTNIIPGNNGTTNNATTNNVTTNNNNTSTSMNNGTTGNNVVTAPDCIALNPALEGECDVLCQSGCMVGQACTIDETTMEVGMENRITWVSSCAAAGAGEDGAACTADEDCAQGFGCIEEDAGTVCREYCRTGGAEAPQCPTDLICVPFITEIRVGTCQVPPEGCTVFPNSCGDDEQCQESVVDGSTQCLAVGEVARGEVCDAPGACQEGLRCYSVGGAQATCVGICDPNGLEPDLSCRDEETCNQVADEGGNDLSWGACY